MTNVPGGLRASGKKSPSVEVAIRDYPIAPLEKADSFGFEIRTAPVGENYRETGNDDDPYVRSSGVLNLNGSAMSTSGHALRRHCARALRSQGQGRTVVRSPRWPVGRERK